MPPKPCPSTDDGRNCILSANGVSEPYYWENWTIQKKHQLGHRSLDRMVAATSPNQVLGRWSRCQQLRHHVQQMEQPPNNYWRKTKHNEKGNANR